MLEIALKPVSVPIGRFSPGHRTHHRRVFDVRLSRFRLLVASMSVVKWAVDGRRGVRHAERNTSSGKGFPQGTKLMLICRIAGRVRLLTTLDAGSWCSQQRFPLCLVHPFSHAEPATLLPMGISIRRSCYPSTSANHPISIWITRRDLSSIFSLTAARITALNPIVAEKKACISPPASCVPRTPLRNKRDAKPNLLRINRLHIRIKSIAGDYEATDSGLKDEATALRR